jgi:cellobiose epimerase
VTPVSDLAIAREQLRAGLVGGILPFWQQRGLDLDSGGFFTHVNGDGERVDINQDKHVVTQARLTWSFAALSEMADDRSSYLASAAHGIDFLTTHFLDRQYGGFRWRVTRDGRPVDEAKLVFAQSFVLYALAAYARATGDGNTAELAARTFEVLHREAADTVNGGYCENFDRSWRPAAAGSGGGDRKTLDIHLHLLEAFTELYRLTGEPKHERRLREVRTLIRTRMVDHETGAGGMQYSLDFQPIPPAVIDRTWIAERPSQQHERTEKPARVTSYGHNLELAWLLAEADDALAEVDASRDVIADLARHALSHGYDPVYGGVWREGLADGAVTDRDKEFWQNAEALPGFLAAYQATRDEKFFVAFLGTWNFARAHLVHPDFGEWMIRASESGDPMVTDLGNPWKNAYHTGRAAMESVRRIDRILDDDSATHLHAGSPRSAECVS